MAEPKTKENDASVEAFLDAIAEPQKREDCRAICALMQAVTGKEPRMWGDAIVGFGHYTYTYATGRTGDWPLTAFSPRKQNINLYIMAGFDNYDALLARLGKHSTGKSCLYIKRLRDIDQAALEELVRQSVTHMIETNP